VRVALALLIVVIVGTARVIAPTRPKAMPPPFSAPASALIPPPPPRATPLPRPAAPRRVVRPAPRREHTPEPPPRDEPGMASIAPAIAKAPAVASADLAPPIAPSRFQLDLVPPLPPLSRPIAAASPFRAALRAATRPAALVPLYGSFATLQALDYQSTRRALASGAAREANPLMRSIVKNRPAFIAVKAAATAGVVVAGEKMWKKNRAAAVLFVAGANAAVGVVVARNYRAK
jgi:hypothetical protein